MNEEIKDNVVTIAAIGLLAYVSADIAHHVFGHGAACLLLGGRIISLSSVFVNCSVRGAEIDLAGPFANFAIGLAALAASRIATHTSSATRLFYILAAAFNLLWFALQLVVSAATRTDDWAWAMYQYHVSAPVRYGMIAAGALAYFLTIRVVATQMAPFGHPRTRARTIALTAWLAAGTIACATAALDHNAWATLLRHAAPQSLILSIGLLLVPGRANKISSHGERPTAAAIGFSVPWVAASAIVGAASILLLGPGFAIV